jgi:hypothetical protein
MSLFWAVILARYECPLKKYTPVKFINVIAAGVNDLF